MALRQLAHRCVKPFYSYLPIVKAGDSLPISRSSPRFIYPLSGNLFDALGKERITSTTSALLFNYEKNVSSGHNRDFVDLFTNNVHKKFYMPTNTINAIKVYQDINATLVSIEENLKKPEIIDPPAFKKQVKKEAVRMILIRRRKMRKHKLRKLRKRMKFVFEKIKLRRELRKEQAFRTELLTQVEAADKFDAKAYVDGILHTLRYHPKPETVEEKMERFRLRKKKNKYNTTFIRPRFAD